MAAVTKCWAFISQAIMMIEDETGTMALLGRPKKLRTGVLTCLSGFIEQASNSDPH